MSDTRFRPGLWVACAILGLTLAGACDRDLNPQPLPPASDENASAKDASSPTLGATGSSGSGASSGSGSGGFASSSSGGSSVGSGSGAGPSSPTDAGAIVAQDAALEDADEASTAIDAATDAGLASDGGSDGPSPDAAIDDASASDGGCVHPSDCYVSPSGACALCAWPLHYSVCVEHQCRCACDEGDAAGE